MATEAEMAREVLDAAGAFVDRVLRLVGGLDERRRREDVLAGAKAFGRRRVGVLTPEEMRDDVRHHYPMDRVAQALALDAFAEATRRAAS